MNVDGKHASINCTLYEKCKRLHGYKTVPTLIESHLTVWHHLIFNINVRYLRCWHQGLTGPN